MTTSSPALAVIEGKLCRLSRTGSVTATHEPLASAVMEFRHGPMRLYIREHPYGLLPGVPNVYCVDPNFRLLWLADWPYPEDPAARLVNEADDVLTVETLAGATVRLDAVTGQWLPSADQMAAAS